MAKKETFWAMLLVFCATVTSCGGSSSPVAQPPGETVLLLPSSATVLVGSAAKFAAHIDGSSNASVNFSIVEDGGGTITQTGHYVAPLRPGTYHVRATSIQAPSRFAEAVAIVHGYEQKMLSAGSSSDGYDWHTATLLQDGSVLVAGGRGFGSVHDTAEIYVPSHGQFERTLMMTCARMGHTATALPNGDVLVAGGYNPLDGQTAFDPAFRSTEIYNFAQAGFATAPDMNVPRRNHVATVLQNGNVLLTGGVQLRGTGFWASSSSEVFDAGNHRFDAKGQMNSPRWLHTATVLADGRVLAVGGRPTACDANCESPALRTAEIFDPATGEWTATGSLSVGRYGHSAALLPDGRVVIFGGETTEDIGATDQVQQVEVFDPASGTFSNFGRLIEGRGYHALATLNDGRFLIAGGLNFYGAVTSTTEIFDPQTQQSIAGPDMNELRIRARVVKLPTGEILIIGGNSSALPVTPLDLFK